MSFLLGIDLGTSGAKAYLMDGDGRRVGLGYTPLRRLHPAPDWTEQDPWDVTRGAAQAIELALADAGATPADILAIGIASQRDSDFVWDAASGQPLGTAITWQDLRTTPLVEELDGWPLAGERRRRLGYFPGPWCAALHLSWRARHQPDFCAALAEGRLRVGMAAGWLLASMGQSSGHLHDYSLQQKTGLWDIREQRFWQPWVERLGLSTAGLPAPVPTLYDFGNLLIGGQAIPVTAMLGDQQAALFGHGCRLAGQAECTHGTVSFVDVVVGDTPPELDGINVYHAWSLPAAEGLRHTYCLEADTTASGAAARWLATQGGILSAEKELDAVARSVPDAGGVLFVPAFTGLNVPYHDHMARAAILGMSLGSDRAHIVRALLDAIGFQVRAILETIRADTGLQVAQLNVGGGLSASNLACQVQADLLGIPIVRPAERETTARGAALLAGLGAGVWRNVDDLPELPPGAVQFEPRLSNSQRDAQYARWQQAVEAVRQFGSGTRET
jgi:glycerol kinase